MYNRYVMNRHEYRVKLVFALYQSLLLNKDINKSFDDNFSDEEKVDYINVIENDLILNKDNYIQEISSHLRKWTFDRLSYLEQAILLVACSEIKNQFNRIPARRQLYFFHYPRQRIITSENGKKHKIKFHSGNPGTYL